MLDEQSQNFIYEQGRKAKNALVEYYDQYEFVLSFTGNYKQVLRYRNEYGYYTREFLDVEAANKNVCHFITRASRRLFGTSQAQKGKRQFGLGYIEGDIRASVTGRERLHNHMFIGGPIGERFNLSNPEDAYILEQILTQEWNKTKWGYDQIDVRLIADSGEKTELPSIARGRWQSYILKQYDLEKSERLIFAGLPPYNDRA